jgi:hypothetical protein
VIFTNAHRRNAMPPRNVSHDHSARKEVIRALQGLVDGEIASWWINEAGDTEIHLRDGTAFLLRGDGVVRLR